MGPDPLSFTVAGTRSQYRCRDLGDIDRHLRGIAGWLARTLPTMRQDRRQGVLRQCKIDIDALLDARIMLAALGTLDADLNNNGPESPQTPGPAATSDQHVPRPGRA